jgi:hypothetical protein
MNPQLKPIQMEPVEIPLNVISFLTLNSEIPKGRDLPLKIYKLYYAGIAFIMKMTSDDKFNAIMTFKISE